MPRAKLYTEADFPSVKTNVSPSLFISSTKVLSPYSGQPMGYIHQPPLQAILQWAEKNESNLGPGLRASRVLGTAAFDVGSLPLSSENPMQWDFHYHHFIKEEIWQWEERMLNMPVIDTCSVCVCVEFSNLSQKSQWSCKNFKKKWTKWKFKVVAQTVKRLSTMRETRVRSLGQEDPLEKKMAIHSSTIAWRIPWTEKPGRLQSMGSQKVRHDWTT